MIGFILEASYLTAPDIAKIILQDASMTTRVLRLANSSYYNPTGQAINSITRAVIRLGSGVLRRVCLSCELIEHSMAVA
ncbi:MAG TPA: HDOD domain-containing protein [Chromatiales bacterium]|nr:HDOD domain-containing protein [Chromatiales bacterium]